MAHVLAIKAHNAQSLSVSSFKAHNPFGVVISCLLVNAEKTTIIGKTFKTQQVCGTQSPLHGTTGAGLKLLSGLSSRHSVVPQTGETGTEGTDHIRKLTFHTRPFLYNKRVVF